MLWTGNLDLACWFSTRMKPPDTAVLEVEVEADEILANRDEDEFLVQPRPWVDSTLAEIGPCSGDDGSEG